MSRIDKVNLNGNNKISNQDEWSKKAKDALNDLRINDTINLKGDLYGKINQRNRK